ncbi:hypothetical protein [Acinetobacter tianfuensis]|uniref:hypothetical protein n=1 Tax=Acinetobacter tianfuensis TaxID=2419603 RepID=UPI001D17D7CF|nr:hypothetical protein [Acinetobacter tianfuensis]
MMKKIILALSAVSLSASAAPVKPIQFTKSAIAAAVIMSFKGYGGIHYSLSA